MSEEQTPVRENKKTKAEEVAVAPGTSYDKGRLVAAARFAALDRDILAVVLEDGKKYTLEEAQKAITAFKNREVR